MGEQTRKKEHDDYILIKDLMKSKMDIGAKVSEIKDQMKKLEKSDKKAYDNAYRTSKQMEIKQKSLKKKLSRAKKENKKDWETIHQLETKIAKELRKRIEKYQISSKNIEDHIQKLVE